MKLLNLFNYGSTRLDILEDIGDFVMSFVGQILWLFCDIFFLILDLFEDLFRKFAGIDTNVTSATGEKIEGDLVLYFVNSSVVQEIFMAILILSLFLLIIFTIFAIVKNQYSDKQEPVSKFINGSFKALLMYLLVPIATVVCLLVGNIVLQAIDGATKGSANAATASDMLFLSATYNANKLRNGTSAEKKKDIQDMIKNHNLPEQVKLEIEKQCQVDLDSDFNAGLVDFDLMANIIDEAFIAGVLAGDTDAENAKSDKWNFYVVDSYYNSMRISYIIIWAGGAFLIWAIGKITWGMIARLFKMVLYFAISPAVMATFPIDGGKALGAWRGEMVKNGTSAYCAIGVLNILYSILPFFNNIDMFGDSSRGVGITTLIVRLFIYIIAFSSAKDLIGAVSGWFGTGNALADGISASGQVKAGLQKPGKMLTGAATKGVGYFAGIKGGIDAASKHGGNKFAGAMQGLYSNTKAAKVQSDFAKAYQDKSKAGGEQYKTAKTVAFTGEKRKEKLAAYEDYDTRAKLEKQYSALTGKVGQVYDVDKDDGTSPEQFKYREFLKNASDAGQAIYEADINNQKINESKNKRDKEFLDVINSVTSAQKGRFKAEEKLKAEFDALYGAGTWDSTASSGADMTESVKAAIRGASTTGKNVDMLQDLLQGFEAATKGLKDAKEDIVDRAYTDTSFADYISDGVGQDLYDAAMSNDVAEWGKVKKAVKDNIKEATDLVKQAEELEKKIAKKNEEDIFGGITDPAEVAKIQSYRKAHPKS